MAENKTTDNKPGTSQKLAEKKNPVKQHITKTAIQGSKQPQAHVQAVAPTTSVYKPPAGVQPVPPAPEPAPAPAPAPTTPPAEEPGHLDLIEQILLQHETFKLILQQLTDLAKISGTTPGPEKQYYNTPITAIQVATPVQPNSPDTFSNVVTATPGYQSESVYNAVQRISPRITVINDGSDTLYVISTPDSTNWSTEAPILMGEARTFFNVWELRLRSPAAGDITKLIGGIYRVTEFDFWLAYSTNPNRSQFTARRLAVPFPAPGSTISTILGVTVQVPNGFALVIRSNIANAGGSFVFVAGSVPPGIPPDPPVDAVTNVGVVTTRVTLAPGDLVRLFVRNTDSVAILGSVAGLFIDVLVEQ